MVDEKSPLLVAQQQPERRRRDMSADAAMTPPSSSPHLAVDPPSFVSRSCRVFRYSLALIGGILSTLFIAYGVYARAVSNHVTLQDDLILAFGLLMYAMSCTIGALANIGDRQVRALVDAMRLQTRRMQQTNIELGTKVGHLETLNNEYAKTTGELRSLMATVDARYKARMSELKENAQRLSTEIDELNSENNELKEHNVKLASTAARFEKLSAAYNESLEQLRRQNEQVSRDLDALRILNGERDVELESLRSLAAEQKARIAELTLQAENLNKLQQKSVRMIQMLSLYGDDCKTLGTSLKETASELRETDKSLGLTSQEMSVQLKALHDVTEQLRTVAAARGISEDVDDAVDDSTFIEHVDARRAALYNSV